MKNKIFFAILFIVIGFFLISGHVNGQLEQGDGLPERRALVVFYSREGHTKSVAQQLAKKFKADIEEIIDLKKRVGPIAVSAAGKDAVAGNLTKIKPLKLNPKDYDIILIGTPSWFGNVTPAIRTFVKENNVSGKRIGIFGTAHLTGVENALKQLAELINKESPDNIPILPLRHRDLKEEILSNKIDIFYSQLLK